MFKSKLFWIILFITAIASGLYVKKAFPKVMSIVNLSIDMNRNDAINEAKSIAANLNFDISDYETSALFQNSWNLSNYVELEGGGKEKFNELLKNKEFHPYFWVVRFYKEFTIEELKVYFSPAGKYLGFDKRIPEATSSNNLSQIKAQSLTENILLKNKIDLASLELIEVKNETKISNRIDYEFVYEHKTLKINEARFRYDIRISGTEITKFKEVFDIPNSFFDKYENMRSLNSTIASSATTAIAIIYGLGIIFAIIYLLRAKLIIWKAPLYWALFVSGLGLLSSLNNLPINFFFIDTSTSFTIAFVQTLISLLTSFATDFVLLWVSFMIGESLTRHAFPHHIQFWNIWNKGSGNSKQVLGNTLGGYLVSVLELLLVMMFYLFTTTILKWWNPSSIATDPNILATPFPWISPIAQALHAGFWEETLFRALPIAGGILIGKKFNKEKIFLTLSIIVQALIFAAAHANYPTQPGYARLIELILPSLIFAFLYMRFGLLTGIIMHFSFDAILMSMPIWVTKSDSMIFNRIIFLICLFIPLIICLISILKNKLINNVEAKLLNSSWENKTIEEQEVHNELDSSISYNFSSKKWLILAGILGLISFIFFTNFKNDTVQMQINKSKSIEIAKDFVKNRNYDIPDNFKVKAMIKNDVTTQDKFIWNSVSPRIYREYLDDINNHPYWIVKFYNEDENIEKRQEFYSVNVNYDGTIEKFYFHFPERMESKSITEDAAISLAKDHILKKFKLKAIDISLVSIIPEKLPNRTDWTIVLKETEFEIENSEFRYQIFITGDKISGTGKYAFIPEEWLRENRNNTRKLGIIKQISQVILMLVSLAILIICMISGSKKRINKETFIFTFLIFLALNLLSDFNKVPISTFMFTVNQSFGSQLYRLIFRILIKSLFSSLAVGLIYGCIDFVRSKEHFDLKADVGVSFGLILLGIFSFFDYFKPQIAPNKFSLQSLAEFVPNFSPMISSLILYVLLTMIIVGYFVILDQFTKKLREKKVLAISISFLVFTALIANVFIDSVSGYSIILLILLGITLTKAAIFSYKYFFRFSFSPLPFTSAVLVFGIMIKPLIGKAYFHIQIAAWLEIMFVFLLAFQIAKYISQKKYFN